MSELKVIYASPLEYYIFVYIFIFASEVYIFLCFCAAIYYLSTWRTPVSTYKQIVVVMSSLELLLIWKSLSLLHFLKTNFLQLFKFHRKVEGKVQKYLIYTAPTNAQPIPLSTSSTRGVHLLPLMNPHWHIIIQSL